MENEETESLKQPYDGVGRRDGKKSQVNTAVSQSERDIRIIAAYLLDMHRNVEWKEEPPHAIIESLIAIVSRRG